MGKTSVVRDAVEAELLFDPMVDASSITVHNLGGDVLLSGSVPSYLQYLEAVQATRRVNGVAKVLNHLEVVLPPGDYVSDVDLAATANNVLTANLAVPLGVEAFVEDGTVSLVGLARYGAQRQAAADAVAGLAGVRKLKNKIEIAGEADPADVSLLVTDALDRNALLLDDSDVGVVTAGNVVRLSGHVRTCAEHDAVVAAAWRAPGVYEVRDDIHITG